MDTAVGRLIAKNEIGRSETLPVLFAEWAVMEFESLVQPHCIGFRQGDGRACLLRPMLRTRTTQPKPCDGAEELGRRLKKRHYQQR